MTNWKDKAARQERDDAEAAMAKEFERAEDIRREAPRTADIRRENPFEDEIPERWPTMNVTTKVEYHFGHRVYVDGVEVGVVTNYSGAWYALVPRRYPLGVRTKQEAAEKLAADLNKEATR